MMSSMARQMVLLDPATVDWRLDEHTKELGRQGIAKARLALREAARRAAPSARSNAA
jgi:hypothetical protein